MSFEEAALQEYQALRAEILTQADRRGARLAVVWVALSALFAAAAIAEIPEIGCVAILVVCSGWIDEITWFDNVLKAGTYIRLFIEPRISGLRWETVTYACDISGRNVSISRNLLIALSSKYGISNLVSVLFSILLFSHLQPLPYERRVGFWILFAAGIAFSLAVIWRSMRIPKRRDYWEGKFSKFESGMAEEKTRAEDE